MIFLKTTSLQLKAAAALEKSTVVTSKMLIPRDPSIPKVGTGVFLDGQIPSKKVLKPLKTLQSTFLGVWSPKVYMSIPRTGMLVCRMFLNSRNHLSPFPKAFDVFRLKRGEGEKENMS